MLASLGSEGPEFFLQGLRDVVEAQGGMTRAARLGRPESREPLSLTFPPGQSQLRQPKRGADSLEAKAAVRGWLVAGVSSGPRTSFAATRRVNTNVDNGCPGLGEDSGGIFGRMYIESLDQEMAIASQEEDVDFQNRQRRHWNIVSITGRLYQNKPHFSHALTVCSVFFDDVEEDFPDKNLYAAKIEDIEKAIVFSREIGQQPLLIHCL